MDDKEMKRITIDFSIKKGRDPEVVVKDMMRILAENGFTGLDDVKDFHIEDVSGEYRENEIDSCEDINVALYGTVEVGDDEFTYDVEFDVYHTWEGDKIIGKPENVIGYYENKKEIIDESFDLDWKEEVQERLDILIHRLENVEHDVVMVHDKTLNGFEIEKVANLDIFPMIIHNGFDSDRLLNEKQPLDNIVEKCQKKQQDLQIRRNQYQRDIERENDRVL